MEYKVNKQHWGDKQYFEGDTREVKNDSDAKELMRMGMITDPKVAAAEKEADEAAAKDQAEKEAEEAKAKADAETKNKMAKKPANKSE